MIIVCLNALLYDNSNLMNNDKDDIAYDKYCNDLDYPDDDYSTGTDILIYYTRN